MAYSFTQFEQVSKLALQLKEGLSIDLSWLGSTLKSKVYLEMDGDTATVNIPGGNYNRKNAARLRDYLISLDLDLQKKRRY